MFEQHVELDYEIERKIIQEKKQLLDEVLTESEDDVLIISHGWIMLELKKELMRRGFYGGARLWRLKNGKLYLFERTSSVHMLK